MLHPGGAFVQQFPVAGAPEVIAELQTDEDRPVLNAAIVSPRITGREPVFEVPRHRRRQEIAQVRPFNRRIAEHQRRRPGGPERIGGPAAAFTPRTIHEAVERVDHQIPPRRPVDPVQHAVAAEEAAARTVDRLAAPERQPRRVQRADAAPDHPDVTEVQRLAALETPRSARRAHPDHRVAVAGARLRHALFGERIDRDQIQRHCAFAGEFDRDEAALDRAEVEVGRPLRCGGTDREAAGGDIGGDDAVEGQELVVDALGDRPFHFTVGILGREHHQRQIANRRGSGFLRHAPGSEEGFPAVAGKIRQRRFARNPGQRPILKHAGRTEAVRRRRPPAFVLPIQMVDLGGVPGVGKIFDLQVAGGERADQPVGVGGDDHPTGAVGDFGLEKSVFTGDRQLRRTRPVGDQLDRDRIAPGADESGHVERIDPGEIVSRPRRTVMYPCAVEEYPEKGAAGDGQCQAFRRLRQFETPEEPPLRGLATRFRAGGDHFGLMKEIHIA